MDKSNATLKNIALIKNLVLLASIDGKIDIQEKDLILSNAQQIGISKADLDNWIQNAHTLVLEIPKEDDELERHLINMINLSFLDGEFSQEEYDLCKMIADKLDYSGLHRALTRSMNRSHLKNLVVLAATDGEIHETEIEVLYKAADNAGIAYEEVHSMISKSKELQYLIPESDEDKEMQLIQMLSLAIADGKFTVEEYELCKSVAKKLGFDEFELKLILNLSFKKEVGVA